MIAIFLSTLSLRRATNIRSHGDNRSRISIHALLAESDVSFMLYDTSSLIFLSTLSLRRATIPGADFELKPLAISIHALLAESDAARPERQRALRHFYPRSPCGERRKLWILCIFTTSFLSTLSLRRATAAGAVSCYLLSYFYPRSPCGERQMMKNIESLKALYFYPRSPCGERRGEIHASTQQEKFLSTLSLRRATIDRDIANGKREISIHALLAESDRSKTHDRHKTTISIHALLAESDGLSYFYIIKITDFYPRSPCGERQP